MIVNVTLYLVFCFFALPFIQAWAELGKAGLRPVELSARMNRNITLLMLGCLALMPVCLALGFGLGNIDWKAGRLSDQFESWNPISPFGFFSLVIPLTFAGAIAWSQNGAGRPTDAASEWPVLPFLRKTIGAISGWVAIVAGIAMAGILLDGLPMESFRGDRYTMTYLRMVPAALFWTACSMSVREGRWETKSPLFRKTLAACTVVFPVYMLWLIRMQWSLDGGEWYDNQRHPAWNWQNLSLGVLLLASLGHGAAVCLRRWPTQAACVNVGVHICIMVLIAATRLPFADPLRYEAEAKAAWLVEGSYPESWRYASLLENFGRYGVEALDQLLAAQGLTRDAWQADKEALVRESATLAETRQRQDRAARLQRELAATPRRPESAELPEGFVDWLAGLQDWTLDGWMEPEEGRLIVFMDIKRYPRSGSEIKTEIFNGSNY